MRTGWMAIVTLAVTAGCTGTRQTDVVPAPGAERVPGPSGMAAEATAAGVHIVAGTGAWEGTPDLEDGYVPLRLRIENRAERPLLVRYSVFELVVPEDGTELPAIPPFRIDVQAPPPFDPVVGREPITPAWGWDSFALAPAYAGYYGPSPVWEDTFFYDDAYGYDDLYGLWAEAPPRVALERALPEGVLESGGRVEGFLYFPEAPEDARRVQFRAELIDARTGEPFGIVAIPLEVVHE